MYMKFVRTTVKITITITYINANKQNRKQSNTVHLKRYEGTCAPALRHHQHYLQIGMPAEHHRHHHQTPPLHQDHHHRQRKP